jgi:hypothetical protein
MLPLMLMLIDLPAFGALTLAGHIERALRSWFDQRPTSGANRCKAPQPSFAGTACARNCIRNTPLARRSAKKRRRIMRFILCIVLVMLLPASALAAKGSGA